MTSPSNRGGRGRRRRDTNRGAGAPAGASRQRRSTAGDGEETAALSRTLFSFLEPSLDAIGSFGAPIVFAGILGLVSGIVVVAFVGSMFWYGVANIAIGGGLILMVALIALSSVMAAFFSRTGRYGVNTAIMIAAFTAIVVVINVVAFQSNSRTDVTATNQFSLHGSTKQLLQELEQPVRATAFYAEDADANQDQEARDRLERRANVQATFREFEATQSGRFEYRFVDHNLEPELVRDYFGNAASPFVEETIVVENLESGVSDVIYPSSPGYSELEQDLYSSILVVTGQEQKTIYFLGGHGERSIRDTGDDGYAAISAGLEGDNYDVRTLWWDASDENVSVPDTPAEACADDDETCLPAAALLVIAGPTSELPEAHAAELNRYLTGLKVDETGQEVDRREAGRLIFLAEPDTPQSFLEFMAFWGLILGQGYIRDEATSIPGLPHTLRLSISPDRQILETLEPLYQIAAPQGAYLSDTRLTGAAPVTNIIPNTAERALIPLAVTSGNSYLIDDLTRTEPRTGGETPDPIGPFQPIVYVGPVDSPESAGEPVSNRFASMVIFGDSDFVSNFHVGVGSGSDFFLNSANYLLGDYSLVSIRPKHYVFREFNLDRDERRFVRWSSILLIPGFLGLMAAYVWWVRR